VRDKLYKLLGSLGFQGPPMEMSGLEKVLAADRDLVVSYIEARADKVERHGGKASARQLRVTASDLRAGLHIAEHEPTS
jgi:hypothetical protein